MLTYHPAYDVYHSAYRTLLVTETAKPNEIKWDVLRIIDFYILFPSLLRDISFPQKYMWVSRRARKMPDAYVHIPNPSRLLFELNNIQLAGVTSLIARDLISKPHYQEGKVVRTGVDLPKNIAVKITADPLLKDEIFQFLVNELPSIEFTGPKGVKSRTGLMEFRYDLV